MTYKKPTLFSRSHDDEKRIAEKLAALISKKKVIILKNGDKIQGSKPKRA